MTRQRKDYARAGSLDADGRRERRHRPASGRPRLATFGDVEINLETRAMRKRGREVALTLRACELLLALYLRCDTVAMRR